LRNKILPQQLAVSKFFKPGVLIGCNPFPAFFPGFINDEATSVKPSAFRVFPEMIGHSLQGARKIQVIRIQPADDLSCGHPDAFIDGISLAAVSFRNPPERVTGQF